MSERQSGLEPLHKPEVLFGRLTGMSPQQLPDAIHDPDLMAPFLYPLLTQTVRGQMQRYNIPLASAHNNVRTLCLQHQGVKSITDIHEALAGVRELGNNHGAQVARIVSGPEKVFDELQAIGLTSSKFTDLLDAYLASDHSATAEAPRVEEFLRIRTERLKSPVVFDLRTKLAMYLANALDADMTGTRVRSMSDYLLTGPSHKFIRGIASSVETLHEIVNSATDSNPHYVLSEFNTSLVMHQNELDILRTVLDFDETSGLSGLGKLLEARPFADEYILRRDIVWAIRKAIVIALDDTHPRINPELIKKRDGRHPFTDSIT